MARSGQTGVRYRRMAAAAAGTLFMLGSFVGCTEERAADSGAAGGTAAAKPNLVLVVVDTVRADRLSAYGYERPTSPFLEQLSRAGMRFENAYAQGTWTRSTIPTLLTSTYVSEHGNVSYHPPMQQLPSCEPVLPEILQQNGYDTAAFTGTLLPGSFYEAWGWARGFAHVNVDWYARESHARDYPKKEPRTHRQIDVNIVRDFADWLSGREDADPYFAYIHLLGGHGPYETPEAYASRFVEPELHQRFLKEFGHSYEWDPARAADHPDELKYISSAYDANLRFTDQNLRYIVEELDKRGQRDNTVVMIVADHGENLLENGLPRAWLHGAPNPPRQPLVRIPLIVSGPGVPENVVVKHDVMQIDVAPTLLSLAGIEPPESMRGVNLLDGRALDQRRGAVIESDFFHKIKAVAMGRWKYTRVFPDANLLYNAESGVVGETLIDLQTDPEERHNIAPLHPDETRRMRNILASRVLAGASGWHIRLRGSGTPEDYRIEIESGSDIRWVALHYQHPESPVDLKTIAATSVLALPQPALVGEEGLSLRGTREPPGAQAYVFGAFARTDGPTSRVRMWLDDNPIATISAVVGTPAGDWALLWGYALGPLSGSPTLEIRAEGEGSVQVRDAFVSPAPDAFAWEALRDSRRISIPVTVAEGMMDVNVQFVDEPGPVTIRVLKDGQQLNINRMWIAHTPSVRNPITLRPQDAFWPSRNIDSVGNRLVDVEIYYSGLCGGTAVQRDPQQESEAVKRLRALGYLQ